MSDYDDFDDDYDDWLYVEEHYDTTAELAEYTCPSPTFEALADDDLDPYSYFSDIAYLSDSYYDCDAKQNDQRMKRKIKTSEASTRKAHKASRAHDVKSLAHPPVVWRSTSTIPDTIESASGGRHKPPQSFALLKDWRERFRYSDGLAISKSGELSESGGQDETPIQGDQFNLKDLSSVAGMLSGDELAKLKTMLASQGLDPSALELVLNDMIAGKEPDFVGEAENADEESEEEEAEEEDEGEEAEEEDNAGETPEQSGSQRVTSMPRRSLKRRSSEDSDSAIQPEPPPKRKAVEQSTAPMSAEDSSSPHQKRNSRSRRL
ncbi:MAG: hypothetical protein M1828_000267 [Chrysothrix sp. TS-e1954]|nr:MAG: hypothetical protein M1828_000267 [Chrysothrix sp. TS-e1954]